MHFYDALYRWTIIDPLGHNVTYSKNPEGNSVAVRHADGRLQGAYPREANDFVTLKKLEESIEGIDTSGDNVQSAHAANIVYGTDSSKNNVAIARSSSPLANAISQYDSNGRISTNNAMNPLNAINLTQLQDVTGSLLTNINTKVDKVTTPNVAYANDSTGQIAQIPMSVEVAPNALPVRDIGGQIKVPLEPMDGNDAASKNYVLSHSGDTSGVPIVPLPKVVYVNDDSATPATVPYSNAANGGNFIQRDENGDFYVNPPTLPTHPATREYVDAIAMTGTIPPTGTANTVIGYSGSGNLSNVPFSTGNTASTLAMRTSTGDITVALTPSTRQSATSREYVDTHAISPIYDTNSVYGTGSSGEFQSYRVGLEAGAIVQRATGGNVLLPSSMGDNPDFAASKSYVDAKSGGIPQLTTPNVVYATNSSGELTGVPYTSTQTANAIARYTATGGLTTTTAGGIGSGIAGASAINVTDLRGVIWGNTALTSNIARPKAGLQQPTSIVTFTAPQYALTPLTDFTTALFTPLTYTQYTSGSESGSIAVTVASLISVTVNLTYLLQSGSPSQFEIYLCSGATVAAATPIRRIAIVAGNEGKCITTGATFIFAGSATHYCIKCMSDVAAVLRTVGTSSGAGNTFEIYSLGLS